MQGGGAPCADPEVSLNDWQAPIAPEGLAGSRKRGLTSWRGTSRPGLYIHAGMEPAGGGAKGQFMQSHCEVVKSH